MIIIYNIMKRYFSLIVLCIMCASCDFEDRIKLEKHYFEVDYKAQEVILKTDEIISGTTYWYLESDVDSLDYKKYETGTTLIIENGENSWFKLTFSRSDPYRVLVSLKENLTGKDRKLKVEVYRHLGQDFATIVQKKFPPRT